MNRVIDFIKPNEDCQLCDHHNDYTCFDCEEIQIKKKYPHSIYNNDCQWEIKNKKERRKNESINNNRK
jgi:hypothetical protein